MPLPRTRSPRLNALAFLLALIAASLALAVTAEGARIAWLEGLAQVPSGLASIVAGAWLTDGLVLMLAILFFWALTNRLSAGILLSAALTGAILFAHVQKVQAIGKPLAMSDLALLGDVLTVAGGVVRANLGAFVGLGMGVALVAVLFVLLIRRPSRFPLKPAGRIAIAFLVMAFGASGILEPPKDAAAFIVKGTTENGFLCGLLRSPREKFCPPENYSKNRIFDRLSSAQSDVQGPSNGPRQPDIVLYFGESFMDVDRLTKVIFNRDPTPNFHHTTHRALSGRIISPESGGVTANVEFEVFTGHPVVIFSPNAVPYHHNIHRPLESLPRIFQNSGYGADAFHNFYKNLYSYDKNYPLLGFENFYDISRIPKNSFSGSGKIIFDKQIGKDVLFDGPFPSDEPLVMQLIERLNAAEQPAFLFGLSMVAHGGYDGWPEDQKTVRIVSEGLSRSAKESLEHLANALNRADIALGHLIRAVEARERPTVLFFMGDHLPYISDSVLREGGFDFGPNGYRRYEVPFFVLANFPLPELDIPDRMSAFYLPAKILRAAGIDGGPYFRFLESKLGQITAMNHNFLLLPDGREFSGPRDPSMPPDVAKDVRALLDDFALLAWDRLSGEEFSCWTKRAAPEGDRPTSERPATSIRPSLNSERGADAIASP